MSFEGNIAMASWRFIRRSYCLRGMWSIRMEEIKATACLPGNNVNCQADLWLSACLAVRM